jgi:MFS family permease
VRAAQIDKENIVSHTHPVQPDPRRWKALALLCTAFFMVILDSAIVIVALPSIDADLAFSGGDLQWVLSAYLLAFGGLLLLGGRAADLLGRRRMFIAGTGLFALASLGAGLAGTSEALLAARVVQGVAAAIMTPTALSIVMTTFPEGGERNKALGIWGSTGAIGGPRRGWSAARSPTAWAGSGSSSSTCPSPPSSPPSAPCSCSTAARRPGSGASTSPAP